MDLEALAAVPELDLPLIVNRKRLGDEDVLQLETAMGAALAAFEGAAPIHVPRGRFAPVKTTDDLLVLRSDCYDLDEDYVLHRRSDGLPFVELGKAYKFVGPFSERFPDGVPSLRRATALRVPGNWTFGAGVTVVGNVTVEGEGGTIPPGTVLEG